MHSMVQLGFASTRVIQRKLFSSVRSKAVTHRPLMGSLQGVLKHLIKPRILRWCHPPSVLLQANHIQLLLCRFTSVPPKYFKFSFYLIPKLILTAEKLWIPLLITNLHVARKRPRSNGRHTVREKSIIMRYLHYCDLWGSDLCSCGSWQQRKEGCVFWTD